MVSETTIRKPATSGSTILNEEQLVARAKDLDADAWEEIFTAHYAALATFLRYRVGDATAGEDLASQVFAEAIAGIGRYRHRGIPLRAWLFRIARNISSDHLRKERRNASIAVEPVEKEIPTDALERGVEAQQLVATLTTLTDEQRQVLILRFVNELSISETARVMRKSEGAVKTMQHRALAAARRGLVALDPATWRRGDA